MRAGASTGAGAGASAGAAGAGGAWATAGAGGAGGAVVTGATGAAGLGAGLGAAGAVVTRGRAVVVVLGAAAAVDPLAIASKLCVVHIRPAPSMTTATPTVLKRGSTRFS